MEGDVGFAGQLEACCFLPQLCGCTKDEILEEMVHALCAANGLVDVAGILAAVRRREGQSSTGMQQGVALPHGKHVAVSSLVTAIGLKPEGLGFDARDHQPSRIFVMTVSSSLIAGQHLHFLSEIGRLLGHASVREAVLKAKTKAMLKAALLPRG